MPRDGFLRDSIRLCPAQIACDGATLARNREICRRCEEASKRRTRPAKPLRGEKCEG